MLKNLLLATETRFFCGENSEHIVNTLVFCHVLWVLLVGTGNDVEGCQQSCDRSRSRWFGG